MKSEPQQKILKICFLLPSFLPEVGGLEKAADRLASRLAELGHEIVILTRKLKKSDLSIKRDYTICYYEKPLSPTWWPFSIERDLKKCYRYFQFDLIFAYQPYPPGYIAARFGKRHNLPVIISCRGGDVGERSRYLKRWISRKRTVWALKNANVVHSLSRELSNNVSMLTKGKISSKIIHNGVDVNNHFTQTIIPRKDWDVLRNRPFILTLGRLKQFKGLHVLINAIGILKKQNIKFPATVIAGDGPDKEIISELVQKNGLTDSIHFVGNVSGPDKAWLLTNCLFLVHPSLGGEGMPNSVLEAMSFGKPVVGTDVGGLNDLIEKGCGGILAEADNAGALAHAIRQMLLADVEQYGRDATEIAKSHSFNKIADQYIDLFNEVLNEHSKTKPKNK